MMGFIVICLIVLSFSTGKWWLWLITILFGLIWSANKNQQSTAKNEINDNLTSSQAPKQIKISDEPYVPPYNSSNYTLNKQTGSSTVKDDSITQQSTGQKEINDISTNSQLPISSTINNGNITDILINICNEYKGNDFFVHDSIPAKKLENSKKKYPVPNGGPVLALIDATVFGSAEDGLAIGEHGICFNSLNKTHLVRWKDFTSVNIKRDGSYNILIDDMVFNMAGSTFDKDQAVGLLKKIRDVLSKYFYDSPLESNASPPKELTVDTLDSTSGSKKNNVAGPVSGESDYKNCNNYPIDINTADYDVLLSLPGIGAVEAKRLIDYRQQHGPFSSNDSITAFLKLKPHHAKQWEGKVIVSINSNQDNKPSSSEFQKPGRGRTID